MIVILWGHGCSYLSAPKFYFEDDFLQKHTHELKYIWTGIIWCSDISISIDWKQPKGLSPEGWLKAKV